MKYLTIYKKLGLDTQEEVFRFLIDSLTNSIFTWDYFVDYTKVKNNVKKIERELNLLNCLLGKTDIEEDFIDLIKEYPKVRSALPILIAIRKEKLGETYIIDDFDELSSENKKPIFDPKIELNKQIKEDLIQFFSESGLKEIFTRKDIKSVVDYCFGVEVGMDTNARKNRTGQSMEKIVEEKIAKFSEINGLEFIPQATKVRIQAKWNINIEIDKTNRQFDFAVYNKKNKKIFIIETNFYSGGGSKLKSTAGEYQYLYDFLRNQNIDLIWITDGLGWKTTTNSLYETFLKNDYVINLELIKRGILKEILLE